MKKLLILSTLVAISMNVCEGTESPFNNTNEHYLLVKAFTEKNVDLVRFYIDKGANPNARNNSGNTLLSIACKNADEIMVKTLIECGANVDEEDEFGNTPLITATYCRHIKIVKYLIENGANVNKKGEGGKTPLSIAKTFDENDLGTDLVQCLINNGAEESFDSDCPNEKEIANR